ncbi:MAG: RNA polymerase sigma factor [Deltaproteobacteria bacterium]|nr:RNA polymerase sigma factor [Deltaproteobacteria bacterium]
MSENDIELVRKALDGDRAAFDLLVRRSVPRVFGIIHRFFNERQTVEDLAQEAFIKAYTALATYRQERPFGNWLAVITVRLCYQELRKRKARREQLESELKLEDAAALDDFCSAYIDNGRPDPEKQARLRDLTDKVLEQLSPRERMVLVLTEVEGLSVKEVAEMMGMTRINVKVSNHRARKHALKIVRALSSPGQAPNDRDRQGA